MNKYYVVSPTKCECGKDWSVELLTNISSEIERYESYEGYARPVFCSNCNKKYDISWTIINGSFYNVELKSTDDDMVEVDKIFPIVDMCLVLNKRISFIEKKLKIK